MARKKQNLLNGALVLVIAMGITKVIGAIFKIPLTNILGTIGRSYYSTAYDVYIPIYSIALAGLPVAISKTVSAYAAQNRYRDVKRLFRVGKNLFFVTGIIGFLLCIAIAVPYTISMGRPKALYAVICVAPSVFFCCVMSAYRGYYNGLCNMTPQAISEVIEAAAKMLFGLLLSKAVLTYGLSQAETIGNTVFGLTVTETTTEAEILASIAPFAAAGAILGVTIGTVLGTLFLFLKYKIKGDGITEQELRTSPAPDMPAQMRKALWTVAVPIVLSTLIFNITNLIDTWSIQYRLASAVENGGDTIRQMYGVSLEKAGLVNDSTLWPNFLHGAYEIAVDFKNMIPTLTTVLGISAIPILSEAWTLEKHDDIKLSVESVIRMSLLIAFPAGFGMAVLAKPILMLMYGDLDSADIAYKVMIAYGFTVFIIALSQPVTNMLQTLGKPKIPMWSILVGVILKIGVNFILIAIPKINIFGAIVGTLVCYTVSLIINIIFLLKITKVKFSFFGSVLKPFFCAAACAVTAYFSHGAFCNILSSVQALNRSDRINITTISAVLAICAGALVYAICLLLTRTILESDVKMLPKGEKIAKALAKFKVLG